MIKSVHRTFPGRGAGQRVVQRWVPIDSSGHKHSPGVLVMSGLTFRTRRRAVRALNSGNAELVYVVYG